MTMMEMFEDPKRVPGDPGWDPMGLYADDKKERYQMAELQHGRLAMIAIGGMIHGPRRCSKRERYSQLQRLLSRPFSTRFG